MSIQRDIVELQNISMELTRINKRAKELRKQKTEAEQRIVDYLEHKDQPGVKFNGTAVYTKTKNKREYKNNKDKMYDAMSVLEKYGIRDTEKVYQDIIDAMRGDVQEVPKIKVEQIKRR